MTTKVWSWEFDRSRRADGISVSDTTPRIDDEYWERLLKAVPVPAVGFVTAATALASAATGSWLVLATGGVLLVGLALPWVEMRWWRHAGNRELAVALAAYVVWSYAQGGFFEAVGWWQPIAAGLVALAFAALLPYFARRRPPAPPPSVETDG